MSDDDQPESPIDHGELDEALALLAGKGPEYGPYRFSNHGPMGAEALSSLGVRNEVVAWTAAYRPRLEPSPDPAEPLASDNWESSLGEPTRFPAWVALFESELKENYFEEVVEDWVPRLVPGTIAAAGHGLIRTGHAVRSLGRLDNEVRRSELAQGMAYWAVEYRELPGPALLLGRQSLDEAMTLLPYLPIDTPEENSITDQVAHLDSIAREFEQAVISLAAPDNPLTAIDALAVGGAWAYLANADGGHAIALLHTITTPLALELLLPWLGAGDALTAVGYAWQAVAAIDVAYANDRHRPELDLDAIPAVDELIELAVTSSDEHAIKLTEAALRCFERTNEPVLLAAAADASRRFG